VEESAAQGLVGCAVIAALAGLAAIVGVVTCSNGPSKTESATMRAATTSEAPERVAAPKQCALVSRDDKPVRAELSNDRKQVLFVTSHTRCELESQGRYPAVRLLEGEHAGLRVSVSSSDLSCE
jgi:hypothetical protein